LSIRITRRWNGQYDSICCKAKNIFKSWFFYVSSWLVWFDCLFFKKTLVCNILFFILFLLIISSFFLRQDSSEKIPILSIDKNKVYIYLKEQLLVNTLYVQFEKDNIESLELKRAIFNTKIIVVLSSKDKKTYNLPSLNKRNRIDLISFLEENFSDKLIKYKGTT